MRTSITFILFALLFGCMPSANNAIKKKSTSLSPSTLGDSGSTPVLEASTTLIEFSNTAGVGTKICRYPSGVCRTDADESSGGASAYGSIPDSAASFMHFMKFRFYSNGYFKNNPDGHIAFGLRGKRLRREEYGDAAGVDGRGIIIGAIGEGYPPNKNNPACVQRMAQIESYFRQAYTNKLASDANKIHPESCSDTLFEDYKWYNVEINVTSTQYIHFRIFNDAGKLLYQSYIYDSPNYLDPNLTEWFVGHVFENRNANYSFKLDNFQVGHVAAVDPYFPVKDFKSPVWFSSKFGEYYGPSAHDFSLNFHKSNPPSITLNNVVARTRMYGCTTIRKTKTGADSIDCQNPANYRMMNLTSEPDWKLVGDKYVYSDSYLISYPNQFYTVYFRLNPQDPLSQESLSFELSD